MSNESDILKSEFAAPFPFPAVDAMMHELVRDSQDLMADRLRFTRLTLTTGSVEYQLSRLFDDGRQVQFGRIFISMLDDRLTYIDPNVDTALLGDHAVVVQQLLNSFVSVSLEGLVRLQGIARNMIESPRQAEVLGLDQAIFDLTTALGGPPPPMPDVNAPLREHAQWWLAWGESSEFETEADYARKIGCKVQSFYTAIHKLKMKQRDSTEGSE